MLSDEEKKAIERAEFLIKIDTYLEKEMLTNLLNLIKKQSKEIEELKEQCKEVICVPEGTCFMIKSKDTDKKWEDKIKARVEELEEYLYKGNIKDDFLMIRIKAKIQELQSLLEKE